ncbi:ABC transporter permease [Pseudonocardia acidicola]|uniref:ABC transporter permease n=1 Tax=Pseudonocardia acidicola TaxID=2724939 RepID=A0ABX1SCL9_9PSEU|nr:ABC transporter permease [Pseudonocardia acidicola]NMH98277.1 ABC transporter permease [Pseudonocardia acidicola]
MANVATRTGEALKRGVGAPFKALDDLGRQASFYGEAVRWVPKALKSYKREQIRLIAEVGMSNGALAVIGGSSVITFFITFFAGLNGGVQAYYGLKNLSLEAFAGFSGAIIVPRLLVPIIGGAALAATVGTGFTAQLGAMRISEEIDALEVMSVRSLPYLVSTRVAAGMITIIPIYAMAMVGGWLAWKLPFIMFYGLSDGTYGHYFDTFMQPEDILYALVQAVGIAIVVILIHTYYGYTAKGGPVGVGEAVGKAVRASLVAVMVVCLLVATALYGSSDTIRISG